MERVPKEVDVATEDIMLIWQLACSLVRAHDGDFVHAFADAAFQRCALLAATREQTGGLVISPPGHPVMRLVRNGADWRILQEE